MNAAASSLVVLGVYFLLFVVVVLAIWRWQISRRGERPPLEFKLLRGPGESLRRRLAKFDEDAPFWLGGAALAPVIVGLFVLQILVWISPHMRLSYGLVITMGAMIIALFFAGRIVLRKLERSRNDRLGYLGERVVGEALGPLLVEGYHIFHDVPAEIGKAKFNVDHVVVGPNGVFAIETKTRRKGRAREGYESYKVAYNGRQLIWPWAKDTYGLEQAANRARWLSDWLRKMTGISIDARPILALPGWYVVPEGIGTVIVDNHKQLCSTITRDKNPVLTKEQMDLIVRQLDATLRWSPTVRQRVG